MIEKIDQDESGKLYKEHMKHDFPKDRMISYQKMLKKLDENTYDIFLYNDKPNQEKAYAICIEIDDYIIIHYMAVFTEFRGDNVGERFLSELAEYYKSKNGIIVATKQVTYAKNGADKQVRQKALDFYINQGYIVAEDIRYRCFKEWYQVAVFPLQEQIVDSVIIAQTIRASYKRFLNRFLLNKIMIKVLS